MQTAISKSNNPTKDDYARNSLNKCKTMWDIMEDRYNGRSYISHIDVDTFNSSFTTFASKSTSVPNTAVLKLLYLAPNFKLK